MKNSDFDSSSSFRTDSKLTLEKITEDQKSEFDSDDSRNDNFEKFQDPYHQKLISEYLKETL